MVQFESLELKDFQAWKQVNSAVDFSLYDYVHGTIQSKGLSSDFCIAFLKLIYPSFLLSGNKVFLVEQYNQTKLNNLIDRGCRDKDLEYWVNILNLDSYFRTNIEEFSMDQCLFFANLLEEIWLQKLSKEFPDRKFVVKCIQDVDPDTNNDEVYITFYQVE